MKNNFQNFAFQNAPHHSDHISKFGSPTKGLSKVINQFKGAVTKKYREAISSPDIRVWQTRFHDRIIRNEKELIRIRHYIQNNPRNWENS